MTKLRILEGRGFFPDCLENGANNRSADNREISWKSRERGHEAPVRFRTAELTLPTTSGGAADG